MSARSLPDWLGTTPDTPAPPRVRLRVYERACGKCESCRRKLRAGDKWEVDHRIAIVNGGINAEFNLQVLCAWCHDAKTRRDVAEKSAVAVKRKAHLGIRKRKGRPMAGTLASGWKKPMYGRAVRR